jgi:hypothetical protein
VLKFFDITNPRVVIFLRFKKEYLESLQILSRNSCVLLKKLNLLPLNSQYIFPLQLFVIEIRIYINLSLRFMILTLDMVLIYILVHQVEQRSKKEFPILE